MEIMTKVFGKFQIWCNKFFKNKLRSIMLKTKRPPSIISSCRKNQLFLNCYWCYFSGSLAALWDGKSAVIFSLRSLKISINLIILFFKKFIKLDEITSENESSSRLCFYNHPWIGPNIMPVFVYHIFITANLHLQSKARSIFASQNTPIKSLITILF